MRVIDLTSEEKDKYENSKTAEEQIEPRQEEDGLDAFSVGSSSPNKEKGALEEAHERVNHSYSLFLQKKKDETNIEDDTPQYIELKNPAGDIKPINKLPEDDPFKTSEEDQNIKATSEKKVNVATFANPFTYKGGVPGFLPNSPTRVPRNQISSYNKADNSSNEKKLNRELGRWNWGAFQFTWLWAIFNTKWWFGLILLLLEPKIIYGLTKIYVSLLGSVMIDKLKDINSLNTIDLLLILSIPATIRLVYAILWGVLGNRISWFFKSWGTIENYRAAQDPWRLATFVLFAIMTLLCVVALIATDLRNVQTFIPAIVFGTLAVLTLISN